MLSLAVIGDPINHSLSPIIHNASILNLGLEKQFQYEKINVKPNHLQIFIETIRKTKLIGFNVTLPHKYKILQYLDKIDKSASIIGAVNTVVVEKSILCGYNTDIDGFINSLLENNIEIKNKNFLVIGAGGAALAVVYGLLREGAMVEIINRSEQNALFLKKKLDEFGSIKVIKKPNFNDFDSIINTTSVGMDGVSIPINADSINDNHTVIDIIYNPNITPLLKIAKSSGARVINGIGMLINQGALSFKLFTGMEPNKNIMLEAIKKHL